MLALGVGATIGQAELHRVVLVEGDQRVVELTKPTTDVAVKERPAIDKLLLKQETSRAF
jgi:hypothetical protein